MTTFRTSEMLRDIEALRVSIAIEESGDDDFGIALAELDGKMAGARKLLLEKLQVLVGDYRQDHAHSPLFHKLTLFGPSEERRREVSYTRALTWLFNPWSKHTWGVQPLQRFCELVFPESANWATFTVTSVYAEIGNSKGKRNDIVACGTVECSGQSKAWKLIIEAKIDSPASREQLLDYSEDLRRDKSGLKLLVLLHPLGEKLEHMKFDGKELGDVEYKPCTYLDLVTALLSLTDKNEVGVEDGGPTDFLRLLLAGLLQDVERLNLPLNERTRQVEFVKILGHRIKEKA